MRVAGVNIPDEKKIAIALTYLYGIGRTRAAAIAAEAEVDAGKRAKNLSLEEVNRLQSAIAHMAKTEGELRQAVKQNIARLKEIKAYRGVRHMRKLPVHGQRTKTNSRTVRGNVRKTAGSGKRKVELK